MMVVLSPRVQRERDAIHRRIARQSGAARANETVGKMMQLNPRFAYDAMGPRGPHGRSIHASTR